MAGRSSPVPWIVLLVVGTCLNTLGIVLREAADPIRNTLLGAGIILLLAGIVGIGYLHGKAGGAPEPGS